MKKGVVFANQQPKPITYQSISDKLTSLLLSAYKCQSHYYAISQNDYINITFSNSVDHCYNCTNSCLCLHVLNKYNCFYSIFCSVKRQYMHKQVLIEHRLTSVLENRQLELSKQTKACSIPAGTTQTSLMYLIFPQITLNLVENYTGEEFKPKQHNEQAKVKGMQLHVAQQLVAEVISVILHLQLADTHQGSCMQTSAHTQQTQIRLNCNPVRPEIWGLFWGRTLLILACATNANVHE